MHHDLNQSEPASLNFTVLIGAAARQTALWSSLDHCSRPQWSPPSFHLQVGVARHWVGSKLPKAWSYERLIALSFDRCFPAPRFTVAPRNGVMKGFCSKQTEPKSLYCPTSLADSLAILGYPWSRLAYERIPHFLLLIAHPDPTIGLSSL